MLKKTLKIIKVSAIAIVGLLLVVGFVLPRPTVQDATMLGGSIYNRFISFDGGFGIKGVEVFDSSGNMTVTGDMSVSGTMDITGITTMSADLTVEGTTPSITIGDAEAEDTALIYDGIAQDFYVALDDGTDDLLIGLGAAVGTTPALSIDENLLVTTYADMLMSGTTPTITIGDAGTEDTAVIFDGQAQDFHIGLEDATDDLVFGLGSALGTTQALGIDENLLATFEGSITMIGTTPILTVGDNEAEDTTILFDGIAQDFYVALDDGTDDLLIGLGSAVGTTPAIAIDENLLVTTHAGITMAGTTPVLTVGDAGEEDTTILFDGIAQDFYVALDDDVDDLVIGLGNAVGTTPALAIDENLLLTAHAGITMVGTIPVLTVGDGGTEDTSIVFDGDAYDFHIGLDDTADDLVIGLGSALGTTAYLSFTNAGLATFDAGITMTGTTPTLTIGDAEAEDTKIVFDGIAQDFYMGLDDDVDDLLIGLGSAVGTTPAISINELQNVSLGVTFDVVGESNLFTLVQGGGSDVAQTGAQTLSAAEMCDNAYIAIDPEASVNLTTDTAANIIADCLPAVGDSKIFFFNNLANAAENQTVVAGANVRLVEPSGGHVIIAQNEMAKFEMINSTGSAVVILVTSIQEGD